MYIMKGTDQGLYQSGYQEMSHRNKSVKHHKKGQDHVMLSLKPSNRDGTSSGVLNIVQNNLNKKANMPYQNRQRARQQRISQKLTSAADGMSNRSNNEKQAIQKSRFIKEMIFNMQNNMQMQSKNIGVAHKQITNFSTKRKVDELPQPRKPPLPNEKPHNYSNSTSLNVTKNLDQHRTQPSNIQSLTAQNTLSSQSQSQCRAV